MDGIEATQKIRAQETRTHMRIPIIAVTANAQGGDRQYYLDRGMDDLVLKPVSRRTLELALARISPKAPIPTGIPFINYSAHL